MFSRYDYIHSPKKNVFSGTSEELGDFPSKESACSSGDYRWVEKVSWRRAWQPTAVFLPGESHGQRSLAATVHGVTESQTRLKGLGTHAQGSDQSGKNYSVWDAGGRSCSQKLNEKGFGDSGE